MSSTTAVAFVSTPASIRPISTSHLSTTKNRIAIPSATANALSSLSISTLFFRVQYGSSRKRPRSRPYTSPVMEWQDCTVKREIDVPVSVAYNCYSDRESIPRWMPFISSVKILEDKPDLSRWTLKYKAFGRNIEFSWLARNMQPTLNQKIHWRSLEGLPNR
ncbi:hypothetical protein Tsubulata_003500 [Turnera subulata]|uniref:Coenzyme Q-binding protein COQ10 START domain-containing protein n=1 Tax=Turnera subulata TaxID=218843 RepID=A0A9Q0JJD6_9ROSI|nr:hypothetical protein Tsubulata_003500 [Turnera subulata]